jgi:replicative DNA helicase
MEFFAELYRERERERLEGTAIYYHWPAEWQRWTDLIRPLRPGQVGILGAPDGVGKSTILSIVSETWADQGKSVVLVHLEDDHEYKVDRRLARAADVPLHVIEDGTADQGQKKRIAQAIRMTEGWELDYLHAPGWHIDKIIDELHKMSVAGKCDAVVLDYIDKIDASPRQVKLYGQSVYERQGDTMEQLKSFAEMTGTVVFTATQANKEAVKTRNGGTVNRAGMYGSHQKSMKAQLVIIATREPFKDDKGSVQVAGKMFQSDIDGVKGEDSPVMRFRVDKQNRGQTGTFWMYFDGSRFTLSDLDTTNITTVLEASQQALEDHRNKQNGGTSWDDLPPSELTEMPY